MPFPVSVFLNCENGGVRAESGRKRGFSDTSDIVDTFSPTSINPYFLCSPMVRYENLDYKKSKFSNIRVFDIRL